MTTGELVTHLLASGVSLYEDLTAEISLRGDIHREVSGRLGPLMDLTKGLYVERILLSANGQILEIVADDEAGWSCAELTLTDMGGDE